MGKRKTSFRFHLIGHDWFEILRLRTRLPVPARPSMRPFASTIPPQLLRTPTGFALPILSTAGSIADAYCTSPVTKDLDRSDAWDPLRLESVPITCGHTHDFECEGERRHDLVTRRGLQPPQWDSMKGRYCIYDTEICTLYTLAV